VSLYLALHPEIFGYFTPLLVSAGLMLYLIGDHLDGMQAKRTATGSALGEFCDHYLDAFNNGVVMFTMATVFGIEHKPVIAGIIVISYWAHMAVFYEQFKTGWLTFEAIGSLEGVMLSALLIALSGIPAINSIFSFYIIADFSLIELLLIASSLGALITFYKTFKRTPQVGPKFWQFTFLLLIMAAIASTVFTAFEVFVVLTLYASLYIGKIMYGHLIDGIERSPDYLAPVIMLLLFLPQMSFTDYIFELAAAYLALTIAILIVRTFSVLKVHWVWLNLRTRS
jgi:ethanolaminephosphotransferase